jgi:KaiC/GvpD/RAD55 family RecA-like ATPase
MVEIATIGGTIGSQYKKPNSNDLQMYSLNISLLETSPAKDFLRNNKGLANDTIQHFNLGYDQYRDYVTIPETKDREIVNIAYRSLLTDTKQKYLKERGCENWIFNEEGIEEAKKKGGLLIVSNQFDAMSAWQVGIKNVISIPVGKNAIGQWITLFDNIPKIYICFENNKEMKRFGIDFADRIGYEKCLELQLPEGIQDLNAYFKEHSSDDFKEMVRVAKPFYKYTYQDLVSVLDAIMERGDTRMSIDIIPFVKIDIDYLFLVIGKSGAGKSTYVMNVADRLIKENIATMVVPYERGYRTVGEKFLQIKFNKTEDQIKGIDKDEYEEMKEVVKELPLYFSKPDIDKMKETLVMAKKLFGVRAVIIDHIEYDTKQGDGAAEKMKVVMTNLKELSIELGVMFFVVNHVKKTNNSGITKNELTMEDSIGGGTTFRVAEGVIIVGDQRDGTIKVKLDKSNHSKTGYKIYEYNGETGVIGKEIINEEEIKQGSLDDF